MDTSYKLNKSGPVILLKVVLAFSMANNLVTAATSDPASNLEPNIPPQCYTKTEGRSNPCWTCHTSKNGLNFANDSSLQRQYSFSNESKTNHWTNLFVDRRKEIAAISDQEILRYIRQDNYRELKSYTDNLPGYAGWHPDLNIKAGFDSDGFAKDQSDWRAIRYMPFPGTFWPTNGSTDDVMIRLPSKFRADERGNPSRRIYKVNLAILETLMSVSDQVADKNVTRRVETISEVDAKLDLDGDGRLSPRIGEIRGIPKHYVGGAKNEPAVRFDYPAGTEFLHTVRYLDPSSPSGMSARMKEVRYAVKHYRYLPAYMPRRYEKEAIEAKSFDTSKYGLPGI